MIYARSHVSKWQEVLKLSIISNMSKVKKSNNSTMDEVNKKWCLHKEVQTYWGRFWGHIIYQFYMNILSDHHMQPQNSSFSSNVRSDRYVWEVVMVKCTPKEGANLLSCKLLATNYMKMKEFGPRSTCDQGFFLFFNFLVENSPFAIAKRVWVTSPPPEITCSP